MNEQEAKNNLQCVIEDLDMLEDSTWIPDTDSIEASRENLKEVLDFLNGKTNKEEHTSIQVQWAIEQVTESLKELLLEKNKRYGNSALEPLEGIKYTPEDGIKIRLADKVKRIINSKELRKNDIADMLGYMILLCVYKEWLSFKDLID